ncbi:MAG: tetratricopeptide repeat protein [Gammaproteobacteria bacterium]|jgi:tetratricopeptide (TPR) repeat protein
MVATQDTLETTAGAGHAGKVSYENLVTIVTAICVFIIASGFFSLARQYPPHFVPPATTATPSNVQGYVRPGAAGSQQHTRPKVRGQSPADPNKQNLLKGLTEHERQLLQERFDQAASLIHAGQYKYAITALNQVIKIQPLLPEAYVNMGYAYLGLKQYDTAVNAFNRALDLRPNQLNAYFGLAESLEGKEDYEGALGAMRTYIHLSEPDDPFLAKARSAVWEWETKLGRKPEIEDQDKAIHFDNKRFRSPH